ncbi:MAG TPA: hypothetical protein VL691_11455 [Vicinamibacteria bacterium]|nr:hypothetical protein [Vicinamibacteria bacterium]
MRKRPVLLVATLLALAPGCGHRGDPLPPRKTTPPAPRDFRLAQRGDALELRATAPTASVEGVVYETLQIEFLHAEGQKDLEKAGDRRSVPATPGQRVTVSLPLPAPGTLVRAAARGVVPKHKGSRTLPSSLVAQAPVEAPRELVASLAEDGVSLSWRGARPQALPPPPAAATLPTGTPPGAAPGTVSGAPPATPPAKPAPPRVTPPNGTEPGAAPGGVPGAAAPATAPAGPRRGGFLVYRRVGGAAFDAPLAEDPLERRSATDTTAPAGANACYVVRAVASTQPLIESAPSNEACVEVRDITAPPVPSGLSVLPGEGGLEVLWAPSAAADLAGYRVYRAAPGGQPQRVAEVRPDRSSWTDGSATRGVVYRYTVSAFDQAGNESEPSEAAEGSLP